MIEEIFFSNFKMNILAYAGAEVLPVGLSFINL